MLKGVCAYVIVCSALTKTRELAKKLADLLTGGWLAEPGQSVKPRGLRPGLQGRCEAVFKFYLAPTRRVHVRRNNPGDRRRSDAGFQVPGPGGL